MEGTSWVMGRMERIAPEWSSMGVGAWLHKGAVKGGVGGPSKGQERRVKGRRGRHHKETEREGEDGTILVQ